MGITEGREVRLLDIAIHISHEDDRITCSLPGGNGSREVMEEGNVGADGVTNGFHVMAMLGEDSLEVGFLGFIGAVSTRNETTTTASVALQAEPGPAA